MEEKSKQVIDLSQKLRGSDQWPSNFSLSLSRDIENIQSKDFITFEEIDFSVMGTEDYALVFVVEKDKASNREVVIPDCFCLTSSIESYIDSADNYISPYTRLPLFAYVTNQGKIVFLYNKINLGRGGSHMTDLLVSGPSGMTFYS